MITSIFLRLLQTSAALSIINIPFDRGANVAGSFAAPAMITPKLLNLKNAEISTIDTTRIVRHTFGDIFMTNFKLLEKGNVCLNIGGDHSVAIPTIFAANEVCNMNGQSLGILWFDAHGDINTPETSLTGNLHGMPVSVLLGHTLPLLQFGSALTSRQFLYIGIRDLDHQEIEIIREENISILDSRSKNDLSEWISHFDKIHISFDVDCISSDEMYATSTPVPAGLKSEHVKEMFQIIQSSGKLLSVDCVEYVPEKDKNDECLMIIVDTLEKLLCNNNCEQGNKGRN